MKKTHAIIENKELKIFYYYDINIAQLSNIIYWKMFLLENSLEIFDN